MPPKKKNDLPKAARMADKENLARAETEIISLQHLLELRSHEVWQHNQYLAECHRMTETGTCISCDSRR